MEAAKTTQENKRQIHSITPFIWEGEGSGGSQAGPRVSRGSAHGIFVSMEPSKVATQILQLIPAASDEAPLADSFKRTAMF